MKKEEFIPYQQALALKELGFDEPCITCYDKLKMVASYGESVFDYKNYNTSNYLVSRPTFSQAFRWFREKHELYVNIFKGIWKDYYHVVFYYNFNPINPKRKRNEYGFKTYEEAELTCLIKLIEIVKN